MNVLEHLGDVLAELLRADERRVLLGEDVADGGMLGLSRKAASDEALVSRLVGTPLTPTGGLAHAGGMAVAGLRPIVLVPHAGALLEGLSGLKDAALVSWRSDRELSAPMLVIVPTGPGFGLGGDAVEAPEAILCRIPGVRVISIADGHEAGAVVKAAAEFWAGDEPTIVLLPRTIALQELDVSRIRSELDRPFAHAHAHRPGKAATVFGWGESVGLASAAVERTGLDVAIVDVGCLAPLDRDGLLDAARSTGRIVITHAGPAAGGVGAELAAMFAEHAILHLDAPVTRVTGAAMPVSRERERDALPDVERLAEAIAQTVLY